MSRGIGALVAAAAMAALRPRPDVSQVSACRGEISPHTEKPKPTKCVSCKGSGFLTDGEVCTTDQDCPECNGTGLPEATS